MSTTRLPIITHEGTSIIHTDEVDLSKENLSGTKRFYKITDWKTASVTIAVAATGASQNVKIEQANQLNGKSFPLTAGATTLTMASNDTVGKFDLAIGGAYIVLDFADVVVPSTGRVIITVVAKRG